MHNNSVYFFYQKRTWMYLTASLQASLYPLMTVVGCSLFLTSSSAAFRSSAATITTDVVPSPTCKWFTRIEVVSKRSGWFFPQLIKPTSSSCNWANSTSTFPAGCSTSSCFRIVAPSFVTITSCNHLCHANPIFSLLSVKEKRSENGLLFRPSTSTCLNCPHFQKRIKEGDRGK